MSFENTLNRFKLISGLSSQEAENWSGLLSDSREYLRSLTVKDELFSGDEKRLDNAAAVYAYYRYLCCYVGEESSFELGDFKVTYNNDRLKAAEKLWESELKSLSDLVSSEQSHFFFKRVE